jgi:hypothetical protein
VKIHDDRLAIHGLTMAAPADRAASSRGPRQEERAHTALRQPLDKDKPPRALRVAMAVAALLAIGVAVGVLTIHDLRRHGGSVPGGVFIALVLAGLAAGMYRRRYWAVLGFEALLAFQIVIASLALVTASTIAATALCVASIGLGGWLFWGLVRVMGRMQAGERSGRDADQFSHDTASRVAEDGASPVERLR